MATDATGTPTSLGIPKFNTSADAPSGLGFNAAMDTINTLIAARMTAPANPVDGDVPVWDNASSQWVRSSVHKISNSMLAGPLGVMTVIFDTTLGAPQATLDSNTVLGGNIPQTYKHLKLVVTCRSSGGASYLTATINGDSGANYNSALAGSNLAGAYTAISGSGTTSWYFGYCAGSGDAANRFAQSEVLFADYTTAANRHTFTAVTALTNGLAGGGGYDGTLAALTRFVLTPNTGNFVAGSRFTLYGIS